MLAGSRARENTTTSRTEVAGNWLSGEQQTGGLCTTGLERTDEAEEGATPVVARVTAAGEMEVTEEVRIAQLEAVEAAAVLRASIGEAAGSGRSRPNGGPSTPRYTPSTDRHLQYIIITQTNSGLGHVTVLPGLMAVKL